MVVRRHGGHHRVSLVLVGLCVTLPITSRIHGISGQADQGFATPIESLAARVSHFLPLAGFTGVHVSSSLVLVVEALLSRAARELRVPEADESLVAAEIAVFLVHAVKVRTGMG